MLCSIIICKTNRFLLIYTAVQSQKNIFKFLYQYIIIVVKLNNQILSSCNLFLLITVYWDIILGIRIFGAIELNTTTTTKGLALHGIIFFYVLGNIIKKRFCLTLYRLKFLLNDFSLIYVKTNWTFVIVVHCGLRLYVLTKTMNRISLCCKSCLDKKVYLILSI